MTEDALQNLVAARVERLGYEFVERFAGQEIAVVGHASLAGRGRRLEGELLGLGGPDGDTVRLQLDGGEVVDIPRAAIARAHLVFRWQDRA